MLIIRESFFFAEFHNQKLGLRIINEFELYTSVYYQYLRKVRNSKELPSRLSHRLSLEHSNCAMT